MERDLLALPNFQVGEFERMSKDTGRSSYTRRIMEIVANIQKQKEEINKVTKLFYKRDIG